MGVVRLFLFKAQSSTPIKIHDPIRKGELTADKFDGVEDAYVQKLDNLIERGVECTGDIMRLIGKNCFGKN
jgi:hypothetical protein